MRTQLLALLLLVGCAVRGPLGEPLWPRHFLAVLEETDAPAAGDDVDAPFARSDGAVRTRVVRAPFACRELVPSWNLDAPVGAGIVLELSVARGDGPWSPWLLVGSCGLSTAQSATLRRELPARTACALGRIEVDTFVAREPIDRARLRARPPGTEPGASAEAIRFRRAAFCFTASSGGRPPGPAPLMAPPLDVPYRSQLAQDPALAPRVCSPASLAMVLAFRGLEVETAELASEAYDPLHDVYGNWSRAVQVAWEHGCSGHVARFSGWSEVARVLASGTPLIASVQVDTGQLTGAPFESSAGHLLVIRGLDANGDVLVNDPAFATEEEGRTRYARHQLERVWFRNRLGTAYVIEPSAAGR